MKKILFCGFMGSGKSTYLKQLKTTAPSSYTFYDLDDEILKRYGNEDLVLSTLIEKIGWEQFRLLESETLRLLAQKSDFLALGGGTLTSEDNLFYIRKIEAILVWLDIDFSICWQRIRNTSRPLAKQPMEALKQTYQKRLAQYQQADFRMKDLSSYPTVELLMEYLTPLD